jgi:hypothetical protein
VLRVTSFQDAAIVKTIILSLVLLLVINHIALVKGETRYRKHDDFASLNWEDTMARLDNYAMQLQMELSNFGVVVIHGKLRGSRSRSLDWVTCIHDYLINRRGIGPDRIVLMKCDSHEIPHIELWLSVEKGLGDPKLKVLQPSQGKIWRRLCDI